MATTTIHDEKLEQEEQRQLVKWAYQGLKLFVQELVDQSFDEAKANYHEQCGPGTPSTMKLNKQHRRELKTIRGRLHFTRKQFKKLLHDEIKNYLEEKGAKSTGYDVIWRRRTYIHI